MEHVVFFPGPDAAPAFRRFGSLEDAVGFVEHLRNAEGVAEVSVHALTPVPLAFRAYYRVEVPADAPVPVQAAPVEPVPVEHAAPVEHAEHLEAAEPPAEAVWEPEPAPVAAAEVPADPGAAELVEAAAEPSPNGKRSLGFFAH